MQSVCSRKLMHKSDHNRNQMFEQTQYRYLPSRNPMPSTSLRCNSMKFRWKFRKEKTIGHHIQFQRWKKRSHCFPKLDSVSSNNLKAESMQSEYIRQSLDTWDHIGSQKLEQIPCHFP